MFKKKIFGIPVYLILGIAVVYFWDKIKPMVMPMVDSIKAKISPSPAQKAEQEAIDFIEKNG